MADKKSADYIREWYHAHPDPAAKACFEDLTAQGVRTTLKSVQNVFSKLRKDAKAQKDEGPHAMEVPTPEPSEQTAPMQAAVQTKEPATQTTKPEEHPRAQTVTSTVTAQVQSVEAPPQLAAAKNKGGRPRSSDKTERMTLMLSPADKKRLALLAAINGTSAADLIGSWIERAYAETRDSGAFSDV